MNSEESKVYVTQFYTHYSIGIPTNILQSIQVYKSSSELVTRNIRELTTAQNQNNNKLFSHMRNTYSHTITNNIKKFNFSVF